MISKARSDWVRLVAPFSARDSCIRGPRHTAGERVDANIYQRTSARHAKAVEIPSENRFTVRRNRSSRAPQLWAGDDVPAPMAIDPDLCRRGVDPQEVQQLFVTCGENKILLRASVLTMEDMLSPAEDVAFRRANADEFGARRCRGNEHAFGRVGGSCEEIGQRRIDVN